MILKKNFQNFEKINTLLFLSKEFCVFKNLINATRNY